MNNVSYIKQCISPQEYYQQELDGSLGKLTGNGWHVWNGLCPFHADRKAGSFYLNIKTGAFKCFSCGVSGGDIISFQQQKHSQSFVEAINALKGELTCN